MCYEEPACCGCLTTVASIQRQEVGHPGGSVPWLTEELTMKGSIGHRYSLHAGTTAYLANPPLIMQCNYEQTCPIRVGLWRTSALSVSLSVAVSEPHLLLMQQSRKKQSKHPGRS